MALQLEPASPVSAAAVGELIDPSRLATRAAEVAARQRSLRQRLLPPERSEKADSRI
jgi:hypothetical protein